MRHPDVSHVCHAYCHGDEHSHIFFTKHPFVSREQALACLRRGFAPEGVHVVDVRAVTECDVDTVIQEKLDVGVRDNLGCAHTLAEVRTWQPWLVRYRVEEASAD